MTMKRTQISITEDQHDILSRLSDTTGNSMSGVLRDILDLYLADYCEGRIVKTLEDIKGAIGQLDMIQNEMKRRRKLKIK